ncbi:hypothetical protein GCM10010271_68100 [Streptomyces kurssanovii]|nr:hypothetical protein GCM10010271_68100 [Streptomyces kurssanovii]
MWLNYLLTVGTNWWDADDEVASEFLFWRVTDPVNEDTVETGTFARDLAGLKKFYTLAARFGVPDPFADMDAPRIVRHADVKWLDPGGSDPRPRTGKQLREPHGDEQDDGAFRLGTPPGGSHRRDLLGEQRHTGASAGQSGCPCAGGSIRAGSLFNGGARARDRPVGAQGMEAGQG